MKQYDSSEQALTDIINEYSLKILFNTKILIALLSDYIPQLHNEQQVLRKAFREKCGEILHTAIKESDSGIAISILCCAVSKLKIEFSERLCVIRIFNEILRIYNKDYSLLTSSDIHNIGMNFYRRFPREDNIPIALLLFYLAGENGNYDSFIYMASSLIKGKGVEQNIESGINLLNIAAENGCEKAIFELAQHCLQGNLIEKNISKAQFLFEQIADTDINAQLALGDIFKLQQNFETAFKWYYKSAENGNIYAQYEVALSYALGCGTFKNIELAKKWLKSAASLGHSEARKKLEELGEKWK